MAAVPSIGRAGHIEERVPREADVTRTLYERYANQIFRYCLHQLGSREEAEDAVQSTFLNAFRGLKRGVVPELESAWLFKIAHNVCLSRRRSSWRRGRIESPADFEVVEELTPAPSRRADELIGLQDVLEQMPENQRRAILLREWQGLSYREIGDELSLSQAAVETLIFRARRTLASGLEQPPERPRTRVARAADWGNVVTAVKGLLVGGSATAKVAATVAVVSATTVVVAAPVQHHRAARHHAAKAKAATRTHAVEAAAAAPAHVTPVAPAAAPPAPPLRHAPLKPARPLKRHTAHAPAPVAAHTAAHNSAAVAPPPAPAPPVEHALPPQAPPAEPQPAQTGHGHSSAGATPSAPTSGGQDEQSKHDKLAEKLRAPIRTPSHEPATPSAALPAAAGQSGTAGAHSRWVREGQLNGDTPAPPAADAPAAPTTPAQTTPAAPDQAKTPLGDGHGRGGGGDH